MRVNTEPVLPGPVSSGGHAGRPAGDDKADTGFDRLLRQTEQEPPAKEQSPTKTRQRPEWSTFAAKLADKATEKSLARDHADKPSDDDPEIGDSKAKRNDQHPQQALDQAPLLAVLTGIQGSPAAGKNAGAASATAQPDPDGGTPAGSPMNKATRVGTGVAAKIAGTDQSASVAASLSASQDGKLKATPVSPGSAEQADVKGEEISLKPTPATHAKPENTPQSPIVRPSGSDKQDASPAHVIVTAEQHFPAPAAHPASQTATSLASAIATDSGVRQAFSPSAGLIQPGSPVAVSSHFLKIELHPAELGMVTANLRLAGGQLSIELTPENHEAHRKLSSDTDTLVKSLQALGFTVDKVTVLQPSVASTAAPRPDAANQTGRDSSSFQPGNSDGNGEPSGGRQSGRNHGNDSQQSSRGIPHPRERTGGDLFI